MKAFTIEQQAEMLRIEDAVMDAAEVLDEASEAYNDHVEEGAKPASADELAERRAAVEKAYQALSVLLEQAESYRQELYDELDAFYQDQTERWQESKKGQAFGEWMAEWEAEMDTVSIDVSTLDSDGSPVPVELWSETIRDMLFIARPVAVDKDGWDFERARALLATKMAAG